MGTRTIGSDGPSPSDRGVREVSQPAFTNPARATGRDLEMTTEGRLVNQVNGLIGVGLSVDASAAWHETFEETHGL